MHAVIDDISAYVKLNEPLQEIAPPPAVNYPSGEFSINNTKVIYAKQGTSMLSIAQEYDIPLSRLLEYNDMDDEEVLVKNQLIYLLIAHRTTKRYWHSVTEIPPVYGRQNTLILCQELFFLTTG